MNHDTPPTSPPSAEPDFPLTDADVTSETRFGPRPVPEGHRRPHVAPQPRRIPPHGDVSPDGKHTWPKPSRSARWLTWGGTAIAAAAVTAGAVLAARHVADLLSDDSARRARIADAWAVQLAGVLRTRA